MRRLLIAAALMLMGCASAFSQTTVNLSVTDTPDNQTWNNGTWSAKLIPGPGNSDQTRNFTLLSGGGSLAAQNGSLSATGTASMSLPANVNIGPAGTVWQFFVCSQAGTACALSSVTVTTSTPQTLVLTPQSIRVTAQPNLPPILVYTTTEISSAAIGSQITVVGSTPSTPALQTCTAVSGNTCTTWAAAGVGSTVGGTVFNVKTYGAVGNSSSSDHCTANGTNLNCTDVTFTAANIGQRVSCSQTSYTTFVAATTTFSAFVNATNMTLSATALGNQTGTCIWGTPDDAGVLAATTAAIAAIQNISLSGNLQPITAAPCLYFPAGAYNLFPTSNATSIFISPSTPKSGFCIMGDGLDITKIYVNTGSTSTVGAISASGNLNTIHIHDLTMDGGFGAQVFSFAALNLASVLNYVTRVKITRFGSNAALFTNSVFARGLTTAQGGGNGIMCSPCTGEFYEWSSSNNAGVNTLIQNVVGAPGAAAVRFVNGLNDEGGSVSPFTVVNSTDVWVIGAGLFSGAQGAGNGCINVDGTSYVHMNGGVCGVFNQDNNETGAFIASGGVLEASDVRFYSTGTGKCINNSGTFINNGANTCESSYFVITAAASAGTTATLTATTQGANISATCAVGDTIQVHGVGVAGYNGLFKGAITAVGTNTIAYTTPGSNLGASSGGSFFCKGYTTYSGNLPYSTLTPTPNTCYVTGTFAAGTLCNQFLDRAINIYHIKASSTTTTACTVAPVVTITDGTNSATLTITTAKTTWDSSVDASTNVGNTIYAPHGGTLTVSTTAGTCTTPPTNFALTYTMQAILDNQ